MNSTTLAFWFVEAPGWLLVAYLAVAQGLSALNYDWGVAMGTQEPARRITPVGVAFFWAFAAADLAFYTPLLAAGLAGHWIGTAWAVPVLAAALGITIYWPLVCLAATARARGVPGWSLPKERDYWIVLPAIALWGAVALWLIAP